MISLTVQRRKNVSVQQVMCTIEEPPGSGCRCSKPSLDGITARCEGYKNDSPGMVFGFSTNYSNVFTGNSGGRSRCIRGSKRKTRG